MGVMAAVGFGFFVQRLLLVIVYYAYPVLGSPAVALFI
jgi:hypothetical protein